MRDPPQYDDSVRNDVMNASAAVAPVAAPPLLQGAVSVKLHGQAATFGLPISLLPESPTTEPRSGGASGAHTVVFSFDKAVTGGVAAVTAGPGTAGVPTFDGPDMTVPLTGVTDAHYVTVTVGKVTAADGGTGGSGSVRIGFLAGDANQNRAVTLSDLLGVNAVLAQPVSAASFLRDVNASGTLSLSDVLFVNARLTQALPAP